MIEPSQCFPLPIGYARTIPRFSPPSPAFASGCGFLLRAVAGSQLCCALDIDDDDANDDDDDGDDDDDDDNDDDDVAHDDDHDDDEDDVH